MGETAENLADLFDISRYDQDVFALKSRSIKHQRYKITFIILAQEDVFQLESYLIRKMAKMVIGVGSPIIDELQVNIFPTHQQKDVDIEMRPSVWKN